MFLADCPARLAIDIIASKWSVVALVGLHRGARRHGELKELIGGISTKVLTDTLRRLESHGLLVRHDFGTVPRRVEYSLTPLGSSLVPHLLGLAEWAESNGEAVHTALYGPDDPAATSEGSTAAGW